MKKSEVRKMIVEELKVIKFKNVLYEYGGAGMRKSNVAHIEALDTLRMIKGIIKKKIPDDELQQYKKFLIKYIERM